MFARGLRGLVVDVFRRKVNGRCFPLGGSAHIYDILC